MIGPLAKLQSTQQVDAFMDRNVELDKINSASTFRADQYYGSHFNSIGNTPQNLTLNSKAKALIESRKRNLSVGFSTMNDNKNDSFNKRLPSEINEEDSLTQTFRSGAFNELLSFLKTKKGTGSPIRRENSLSSKFQSELTKRLANAIVRYNDTQSSWMNTIEKFRRMRDDDSIGSPTKSGSPAKSGSPGSKSPRRYKL